MLELQSEMSLEAPASKYSGKHLVFLEKSSWQTTINKEGTEEHMSWKSLEN